MAQTRALITSHLPDVLAEVIFGYLMPSSLVDYAIGMSGFAELYQCIRNMDDGIAGACKGGYIELIKMIIDHPGRVVDRIRLMYHACHSGQIDVARLSIERGFNYWKSGLEDAGQFDRIDIAKLMIATETVNVHGLNAGLMRACLCGHLEFAKLMLESGADNKYDSLHKACTYKQYRLVKLLFDHGVKFCGNCGLSADKHGGMNGA